MQVDSRSTITLRIISSEQSGNDSLAKQAEITFEDESHEIIGTINLDESAISTALDTFSVIQKRYQNRPNRLKDRNQAELKSIGTDLFDWLNQQASLADMIDDMPMLPWMVEFCIVGRPKTALEKAFLNLPWEILAYNGQFLAAESNLQYSPARRIGKITQYKAPSDKRLAMMFMAASPSGSSGAVLGYEKEENAILQACNYARHNKMDFYVEESGSLNQLKEEISLVNGVDIVHLSCHGTNQSPARLVLENDLGGEDLVEGRAVAQALRGTEARLLVLSACHSAESQDNSTQPLSTELVMSGLDAVIGMGGAVSDSDASGFTSNLYQNLSDGKSIEWALADARSKAVNPANENEVAYDWHLPRLLLRKNGGGRISEGSQSRNPLLAEHGSKESFGDKANPVASRYEFVGRRRQIQNILSAWRSGKQGVLITGMGRQGKSSLALRLAHRLPSYQLVVIYQDYQPLRILETIKTSYNLDAISEIINKYAARIKSTPSNEQLFADCIAEIINGENNYPSLLLVIDDLESALENQGTTHQALHLVKDVTIRNTLAGLVRVFHGQSNAKLLFTSRYEFQLTDSKGKDWAKVLHHEALPSMSPVESRKQFQLKLIQQKTPLDIADNKLWLLVERIRQQAKGSPGLQDFMFSLLHEKPAEVESVLAQLDSYHQTGDAPDDQALNDFFQNLALDSLLALLTSAQRQLLSGLTLFDIPIPQCAVTAVIETCGFTVADEERLLALGLCDTYPQGNDNYVMIHPLLRPKADKLSDESAQFISAGVLPVLWKEWEIERSHIQSLQLLELALGQSETEVVLACCADGILYLHDTLQKRGLAQERAISVMELAETHQMVFENYTLMSLGEVLSTAPNQTQRVKYCYELALHQADLYEEEFDSGSLHFSYAKWLHPQGEVEAALIQLELAKQACLLTKDERGYAAVLVYTARIFVQKGDVDIALTMYDQAQRAFESLGKQHERAVILRDIAQVQVSKSEVNAALALYEEILEVFEMFGDQREHALAMGDVARIHMLQGAVDIAFAMHQERIEVFELLGDHLSCAVALGDIARIHSFRGDIDTALALHEKRKNVFESLGDQRERALALGDIARIYMLKEDYETALLLHGEELSVYEFLDDQRSRAVTLGDIARIKLIKGEFDAAMSLQEERLLEARKMDDLENIGVTQSDIACIYLALNQYTEAAKNLAEAWEIFSAMGRVDFLADVGNLLGQLLIAFEQYDQARPILISTQKALLKLELVNQAKQIQKFIDECNGHN